MEQETAHLDRSIGKRIKRKLEGSERNFDLYQIGTEASKGESEEVGRQFAAEGVTAKAQCGKQSRAGAAKRVEDKLALMGGREKDAFEKRNGLLRRTGLGTHAYLSFIQGGNGSDTQKGRDTRSNRSEWHPPPG